jgi:hypothetical protein
VRASERAAPFDRVVFLRFYTHPMLTIQMHDGHASATRFEGEEGIDEGGLTQDFYTSFFGKFVEMKAAPDPTLVWRKYVMDEKPVQVGMRVVYGGPCSSAQSSGQRKGVITSVKEGRVLYHSNAAGRGAGGGLRRQQSSVERPQRELESTLLVPTPSNETIVELI